MVTAWDTWSVSLDEAYPFYFLEKIIQIILSLSVSLQTKCNFCAVAKSYWVGKIDYKEDWSQYRLSSSVRFYNLNWIKHGGLIKKHNLHYSDWIVLLTIAASQTTPKLGGIQPFIALLDSMG